MSKIPYPCVGGPSGVCKSLCCFQAKDALKGIVDIMLDGHKGVDPKIFDFPHAVDPRTGRCEKLSEDNTFCTVYVDRPLLCNIDAAAKALNIDPVIFMPANADACNTHMTLAGVPEHLQIDVKKYENQLHQERIDEGKHLPQ